MLCLVCEKETLWEDIKKEFPELMDQIDRHGWGNITERQRLVMDGYICSKECYRKLDLPK